VIVHKSYQGKKTSASLDDDLFAYVVEYFEGDVQRARQALCDVLLEALEQGLPLSKHVQRTALQWVVAPKLIEKLEFRRYLANRFSVGLYDLSGIRVISAEVMSSIRQRIRDRRPASPYK
jgi:hypothetical protein